MLTSIRERSTVTDARVDAAHQFDVGPLRLSLRSDALWIPALDSMFAGYHRDPTASDYSAGDLRETRRLHIEADLGVSPPADSSPRSRPAFASRSNGGWSDSSVVWDAEITPAAEDCVRADFLLRDRISAVGRARHTMRSDTVAACLRALLATTAPLADAFLVHAASLISPTGEGMLFLGRSGQGKRPSRAVFRSGSCSRTTLHWSSAALVPASS